METTELVNHEAFTAHPDLGSSGTREAAAGRGDAGRTIEYFVRDTSLGSALVGVTEQGVCAVLLGEDRDDLAVDLATRFPGRRLQEGDEPNPWARQALSYVDGQAQSRVELPLDLKGTEFQKAVWTALLEIPFGGTATYSRIAAQIGRPSSVRAVARACGANPLAVIVPCHRVLRGDGGISGYRWGVERKRKLLDREAASRGGEDSPLPAESPHLMPGEKKPPRVSNA